MIGARSTRDCVACSSLIHFWIASDSVSDSGFSTIPLGVNFSADTGGLGLNGFLKKFIIDSD